MKLLRLSLENWRGIAQRSIKFSKAITLIEGPNEVGKSMLVESLQMLFAELDSSKKTAVKAIQPVGKDVGSRVEVELMTGAYHFVYSKTYNRKPATELTILAPQRQQLTGREAHEKASQILEQTVDMALWNALLVEQGKEVKGAMLAQSSGLATALDQAVGSRASQQDDSKLMDLVQQEYEQYFTLKTGKPRFAGLDAELNSLRDAIAEEEAGLAAVERDAAELDRTIGDIRALQRQAPELKAQLEHLRANCSRIEALEARQTTLARELAQAQELHSAAEAELQRRKRLEQAIGEAEVAARELAPRLQSAEAELARLKASQEKMTASHMAARTERDRCKAMQQAAIEQQHRLDDLDALARSQADLKRIRRCQQSIAEQRRVLSVCHVDSGLLEQLQKADSALQVARGRLELASTQVQVTAHQDLRLQADKESQQLTAGEQRSYHITSALSLVLGEVATIELRPPQSLADLQADCATAEQSHTRLLQQGQVETLAAAVASEAEAKRARQQLTELSSQLDGILSGRSVDELEQEQARLFRACKLDEDARIESSTPVQRTEARERVRAATTALDGAELSLEQSSSTAEHARKRTETQNIECSLMRQTLEGQQADLERLRSQLSKVSHDESNEQLQQRQQDKRRAQNLLQDQLDSLRSELDNADPTMARDLLENAQTVCERSRRELQARKQQQAVLEDRLHGARANGRFERQQNLRQRLEHKERERDAVRRRAAAARRLWQTLCEKRDASRAAYVRPLKEGIERLGRIVFGSDCEVSLEQDWTLSSVTRRGQTLPHEALSVGAREQLGILTRLAAARIVSPHGGVPVILDDALGFSDPQRLAAMGAALAASGKDCQVIILTCSPGRFSHVGNAELVRLEPGTVESAIPEQDAIL